MLREPAILLGVVVNVAVGALGVTGTASAATSGTIVSSANGKCLDVTGGSTANGNQPQMWDCSGGLNQKWSLSGGVVVPPDPGAPDLGPNATVFDP